MNKESLALYRA